MSALVRELAQALEDVLPDGVRRVRDVLMSARIAGYCRAAACVAEVERERDAALNELEAWHRRDHGQVTPKTIDLKGGGQ